MTSEFSAHELNCATRQLKNKKHIVSRRLQHHLEKNGLLSPSQSGFRKNSSTEDQVTLLTQDIENGFQQKMKTLAVFVDLTKAFDKVMEGGSSLQAPKEESLRQHVLMDPELLVPEIRTSQAWRTDHLFSENLKSPTRWSHVSHSLHYFHWGHCDQLSSHIQPALHADDVALWTKVEQVTTVAIRMQEAMESDLKLGKRVVGSDQQNQDWCHLLLPVSKERVHLQINGQKIHQQDTPTYLWS